MLLAIVIVYKKTLQHEKKIDEITFWKSSDTRVCHFTKQSTNLAIQFGQLPPREAKITLNILSKFS